jgi:hypothetical protein
MKMTLLNKLFSLQYKSPKQKEKTKLELACEYLRKIGDNRGLVQIVAINYTVCDGLSVSRTKLLINTCELKDLSAELAKIRDEKHKLNYENARAFNELKVFRKQREVFTEVNLRRSKNLSAILIRKKLG